MNILTILLLITMTILVLYLLYPLYLISLKKSKPISIAANIKEEPVSLILLTYNGIESLRAKIHQLQVQLNQFATYEFIVIDDCSTDGTRELLTYLKDSYNYNLVLHDTNTGIPNSMNFAAGIAKYNHLIFCDQRQTLSPDILKKLTAPLQDPDIGAVSGFISCCDCESKYSLLRRHENFLKKLESRVGSLIGVYGPLYAVKKSCYVDIAHNTILDDLVLSLSILPGKDVVLLERCCITDQNFYKLYDLRRSKRYLKGLLQILKKKELLNVLPARVLIMLIWHKYLRLLIPPMVIACYVALAFSIGTGTAERIIFLVISTLILLSIVGRRLKILSSTYSVISVNFCYFCSLITLMTERIIKSVASPKKL